MADPWVNNGSMQDLSDLAENSMWPTSQAGGNMQSSNREAMTAPGSEPVDPVPDRSEQGDPHIDLAEAMPPGTDGKPEVTGQQREYTPGTPSWKPTTRPKTVVTGPTGATTS
jgi:hypothetical protein